MTSDVEIIEEIPSSPITKAEIRSTIISMKAGKAPGIDCVTVELLKANIRTTVDVLHDLFMTSSVRYGSVRLSPQIGGSHCQDCQKRVETGGGLL